ncbi:MAG: NAD(P)H-dependent oxidoreductase [Planctomycetia bacterium]|jgi:putative NADPH-quinone reductase
MKVLVVIGHQNQGSFCHAITQTVVDQLEADGHEVIYHDLYAEGFDPILTQEELKAEEPACPVVRQHISELLSVDGIVIVHPNWWGGPPAMLRGWVDRVFRQGMVYRFTADGPVGELAGKKALVITTSNTPREVELELYGDPLENLWKTVIFGLVGLTDFLRRNFESVVMSSPEQRADWLAEAKRLAQERFPAE